MNLQVNKGDTLTAVELCCKHFRQVQRNTLVGDVWYRESDGTRLIHDTKTNLIVQVYTIPTQAI